MSFLLDTDICSAHFRRPARLSHRFVQYTGRLFIPTVVLAELSVWAYKQPDPAPFLETIDIFKRYDVQVLPFDEPSAESFGRLSAWLRPRGVTVTPLDLMIASVALTHDLTLVTHNTSDFAAIPGLRLDDWLVP